MSSRPRHSSDAPPTSDDDTSNAVRTNHDAADHTPLGVVLDQASVPQFRPLPRVDLPTSSSVEHLSGGKIRIRSLAADDPLSSSRVKYLVEAFGGSRLAELAGVNRSQPTRWASGDERPGPAAAPLLIDLEHILARARLVWGEHAAHTWFVSANSYLDGARPLDALRISGPAVVLDALDSEMWGGAR